VAAMGWRLLNQKDADASAPLSPPDPEHLERKIFYPLTFPITAGPGTLVVTLTLSAHATKGTLPEILLGQLGLIIGMLLMCVVVYLFYAYAPGITSHISSSTAHGIMRVISFVVICIGVQIAWNGFTALLAGHTIYIH